MKLAPKATLAQIKVQLQARVDAEAEIFRQNFITPGSGQAMVYQQKLEEAREVLRDQDVAPGLVPHVAAEIGIRGDNLTAVAQVIVNTFEQWKQISAHIEHLRMTAKADIQAASSIGDARRAAMVEWTLP